MPLPEGVVVAVIVPSGDAAVVFVNAGASGPAHDAVILDSTGVAANPPAHPRSTCTPILWSGNDVAGPEPDVCCERIGSVLPPDAPETLDPRPRFCDDGSV